MPEVRFRSCRHRGRRGAYMNRETAGRSRFYLGKGGASTRGHTFAVGPGFPPRKFWRPVGWHLPPLGFLVRGPGTPRPQFRSRRPTDPRPPPPPLTLCFSPPRSQVTARSPSTGRPATVTRPRTTRRSSPTTLSSTRTPWASRALWVSRREGCAVLLPFFRANPRNPTANFERRDF